jgi:DNA-binding response OmpR family regulator
MADPEHSLLRLEVGPVDLARRVVRREDQDRTLTTKEAELLAYLADNAGRDIPREELLTEVWG